MKSKGGIYEKIVLLLYFIAVYFVSVLQYSNRCIVVILATITAMAIPLLHRNGVIKVSSFHWIWAATCVVVIFNSFRGTMDNFYLMFYISVLVLLFLLPYANSAWMEIGYNIILAMGVFFAVFTILPVVASDFYSNHIIGLLVENSTFDVARYMRFGIYSGLTYQTAVDATYLAVGIGAMFISFVGAERRKWIRALLMIVEVACILLTAKRGHLLFAGIALIVVIYLNSERNKKFTNLLKVLLVIFLVLAFLYFFVPSTSYIFTKFFEGSDDISNGRYELYNAAIEYFKNNPILGLGWEQFRNHYIRYMDVHNIYLQLLCETGICGAIVFFVAFIATLRMSIKKLLAYKSADDKLWLKYMMLSVYLQTFILLYGLTGNGLYDYYVIFFYFFAVIIAIKCPYEENILEMELYK